MQEKPTAIDFNARFSIAAAVCASLVITTAIIVLVGWTLHIDRFKRIMPGMVEMNPLTAVCFILCGSALLPVLHQQPIRRARRAAVLLCGPVIVFGILLLLQIFARKDLGLDQWMFHASLHGNRVAPNSAVCLVMIALAIIFIDAEHPQNIRPAQMLVLIAGAIASVALLGYLYKTQALYNVPAYIPMALHTGFCAGGLCIAVLCARPRSGILAVVTGDDMGGMLARRLMAICIIAPGVLGWLRLVAVRHEMISPPLSNAVLVICITTLFSTLVWRSAKMLCRIDVERRRAEREVHFKNGQLEEIAESERAALVELKRTQSQLVQTEKLAGLGQMVAGVAHEINNPLSFVSNNVAVLQRDLAAIRQVLGFYQQADALVESGNKPLMEEICELAARIDLPYTLTNADDLMARSREGLRRIQQIVKDLREFARLDESDLHEVDLNEGITSTVNIIKGNAKKNQVEIELDLKPMPPFACYPAKVNQVVMNLLSNAIDASQKNTKVTVRTRGAPDGSAEIQVQDHGKGIAPQVLSRIFDPFFTTKPPGQGTGLGLSISYGIVQDHGGKIEVQSEVGKGACFTVRLPKRK